MSIQSVATRDASPRREAAYVQAAFRLDWLSLCIGLLVVNDGNSLGRDDQRR